MGLFSKGSSGDVRYQLMKAGNREYYTFQPVSRHEFPMLNLAFFEKTLKSGQHPAELVGRIYDSANWGVDVPLDQSARDIVEQISIRTPGLNANKKIQAQFFADVYFGILAGIFERRSGQMKQGLRHPAIWNALGTYRQMGEKDLEESGIRLTEDQALVRLATPFLGYAKGREPNVTSGLLFARW